MTRILIILAILGAGHAVPALAQQSDATGQPGASTPPPKGDAKKDLFKSILQGVVKTVVDEAQKDKPAPATPAEPAAPHAADPAPPQAGTPPVVQPVSASAPAPQPAPPATEPPPPPAPVVMPSPEPAPAPLPATAEPAVIAPPPVENTAVAIAPAEPEPSLATAPTPATPVPPVERSLVWPWLLALLAVAAGGAAVVTSQRARLARTRRLLLIEPRLDSSNSKPAVSPLSFASPPVAIRARLEVRPAHG